MALSTEQIQELVDEFFDSLTDAQRQGMQEGEAVLVPTTAGFHAGNLLQGKRDISGLDYIRLCAELLNAVGYSDQAREYHRLSNLPSERRSLAAPCAGMDVKTDRPVRQSEAETMSLSDLGALRIRTMRAQGLAEKTIVGVTVMYKQFVEILGDRPISSYTPDEFLSWKEVLDKKHSVRTVYNKCIVLSTLFKFAVASDCLERSRVPNWQKPKALKRNKGWSTFNDKDTKALLASSWFVKGQPIDHRGWIPLISMYSGLRIDEVCQLYKNDLVEVDGVLCFSVNDDQDKKVKSDSSLRQVPVHSELIRLGLKQFIQEQEGDRFFPSLLNKGLGYSSAYSKVFGRYLRKHVTPDKGVVFHSLRKRFAHKLSAQSVSEEMIGALLGHSPVNAVTALYMGAKPVPLLKEAVDKIPVKS